MNDLAATALFTLQCHSLDAMAKDPILNDRQAIDTLEALQQAGLAAALPAPKRNIVAYIALRARQYDAVARSFIKMHPESAIVNIGCGFDHRFGRVDNGRILFFDLDLPDVVNAKHRILPVSDRFQYISGSVFDTGWIGQLPRRPTLLLAEGVFMYANEDQVRNLFKALGSTLGSFEIFFEVYNSRWLTGWCKNITERKLKKGLQFGAGASFSFGIADSHVIESWDPALNLIGEWSWFDSRHPSLGALKYLRHMGWLRKIQWSVHYRYGR